MYALYRKGHNFREKRENSISPFLLILAITLMEIRGGYRMIARYYLFIIREEGNTI